MTAAHHSDHPHTPSATNDFADTLTEEESAELFQLFEQAFKGRQTKELLTIRKYMYDNAVSFITFLDKILRTNPPESQEDIKKYAAILDQIALFRLNFDQNPDHVNLASCLNRLIIRLMHTLLLTNPEVWDPIKHKSNIKKIHLICADLRSWSQSPVYDLKQQSYLSILYNHLIQIQLIEQPILELETPTVPVTVKITSGDYINHTETLVDGSGNGRQDAQSPIKDFPQTSDDPASNREITLEPANDKAQHIPNQSTSTCLSPMLRIAGIVMLLLGLISLIYFILLSTTVLGAAVLVAGINFLTTSIGGLLGLSTTASLAMLGQACGAVGVTVSTAATALAITGAVSLMGAGLGLFNCSKQKVGADPEPLKANSSEMVSNAV